MNCCTDYYELLNLGKYNVERYLDLHLSEDNKYVILLTKKEKWYQTFDSREGLESHPLLSYHADCGVDTAFHEYRFCLDRIKSYVLERRVLELLDEIELRLDRLDKH